MPKPENPAKRNARGFRRTGGIVAAQIRKAGESRGFSETRLLTQWAEIAGESAAKISRPVKVSYARKGLGATLTLLTSGASAPMLQMQLPRIRDRVNAAYGYAAISRIQITQTAPAGFAEPQAGFARKPPDLTPNEVEGVTSAVSGVADAGLKTALEMLGTNVLKKAKS